MSAETIRRFYTPFAARDAAGMAACYTPYAFTLEVLDALRVPASAWTFMLFAYGAGAFAGNYLSGHGTDRAGPVDSAAQAQGRTCPG